MAYYEGYDYQGYPDPYVQDVYNQGYQDPYSEDPYGYGGYEGYDQAYEYDSFQPDGSPPPPPDKNWEDPVLLNRSYLEKIEKHIVTEDYKGLNELNMYLFEVFVSDIEIKNKLVDSAHFKDKSAYDFFTSVKILQSPFLQLNETTKHAKATKRLNKLPKIERAPSYTDLFQTVYTEAGALVTSGNKRQSVATEESEESASVSETDSSKQSLKERAHSVQSEEGEEPPKDTTTYSLLLGKSTLFTMTGLSMLKSLMKHDIKFRLSERVAVEASETESEDESDEEVKQSSRSSSAKSSKPESCKTLPKSSKDTGTRSVVSRKTGDSRFKPLHSHHETYMEGAFLGTANVRMSSLYHQAVLQAAQPDATPPIQAPEKISEDLYPLINAEGEEIGSVGISIMMTCLGRAAINCIREKTHKGFEFEHTLFLNTKRFEPSRKSEEPPRVNPKLARYILNLGPVIPSSKTSTEILQECLDNDSTLSKAIRLKPTKKNDCDWNIIARRIQKETESVWTSGESVPYVNEELENNFATRWIDLRRICREMREKMMNDNGDEPKEKSLYERLEEMRMSADESNVVEKKETEIDTDEEGSNQGRSSLARSYSNSASLRTSNSLENPH